MLSDYLNAGVPLGAAQAMVAGGLALLAIWLARFWHIHLERETLVAVGRAIVQVVAVGSILALLLQGSLWLSGLVLVAMLLAAATIAKRRAKGIPAAWSVALLAIGAGAGPIIVIMTWLGVIESTASSLIPVGSMIIANAMTVAALTLNRFRAEITNHVGMIEAGLALGAAPEVMVQPHVQEAVLAGL
ncbi:MAG: ABC transporter permease, partial [Candidatus Promineifilaceae bacterium]|nr:ABC transporter permease [Candidatus Promineifilaceae bacterium]